MIRRSVLMASAACLALGWVVAVVLFYVAVRELRLNLGL